MSIPYLAKPDAKRWLGLAALLWMLTGCAALGLSDRGPRSADGSPPTLTPVTPVHADLLRLPKPKGPITVSVYGFRDQTGQYKPAPASSFSTSVTQGSASMLIKALLESGWFIPVEREGLQDLLTERKIVRATDKQNNGEVQLPPLMAAKILIQGGIIGFDSNVRTGGLGMRYFGLGASELYRVDQVTVNLRAVDTRSGQILASVSTSKTIFSVQVDVGVFRFIEPKRLLESEGGYTENEPAQLCVNAAIESAVIHLITVGIRNNLWLPQDPAATEDPILSEYLRQQQ